ncbi:hypothetical protein ACU686_30880 [Yinghuangia aomiensis]
MGVGGALIMPSTLSILITVFDEDERPKAMAAWSSSMSHARPGRQPGARRRAHRPLLVAPRSSGERALSWCWPSPPGSRSCPESRGPW